MSQPYVPGRLARFVPQCALPGARGPGRAGRRILEVTGIDQLIGTYPGVPASLIGGPGPPGAQPSSKASG